MQITGIILAGGKSKRMGADKAMFKIGNKTLLERAIELCKPFCNQIIISSGNPAHQHTNALLIKDEIAGCGPIGGIYTCLKKSSTAWNLVISVDSVSIPSSFLEFLISETGDFDAIVPFHKNGFEPIIAMYNKTSIDRIKYQIEVSDFKMQNLIRNLDTKYINADTWIKDHPGIFRNINRPADFFTD